MGVPKKSQTFIIRHTFFYSILYKKKNYAPNTLRLFDTFEFAANALKFDDEPCELIFTLLFVVVSVDNEALLLLAVITLVVVTVEAELALANATRLPVELEVSICLACS